MIPDDIKKASNDTAAALEAGAALGAATVQTLDVGQSRLTYVPAHLRTEDVSARLEKPARLTQAPALTTAQSFIDYVNLFGSKHRSVVFANREGYSVVAKLDYHEPPTATSPPAPSWCGHNPTFALRQTKEWQEWKTHNEQPLNQDDFARFIEDHIGQIAEPDGTALHALISDFEATKDTNFRASKRQADGSFSLVYEENIEARIKDGAMPVPKKFVLSLQPFENSPFYRVDARFRFRIQNGKLSLWYEFERSIDPESKIPYDVADRAFEAVVDEIQDGTRDAVKAVVFGTVK